MNKLNENDIEAALTGHGGAPTEADDIVQAVDRAIAGEPEPLPSALRGRLVADGEAFFGAAATAPLRPKPVRWWQRRISTPLPLAAAAAFVAAVGLVSLLLPGGTDRPDPVRAEADILGAGVERIAWQGLGDPTYADVAGGVVWSTADQRGFMRISGVPVNDPQDAQYQLWIVDPARDDQPVDGGVFDLEPGENLVPIDSKLEVLTPRAFAVTLEQPGGVVVSDGPLLFVATLDEGG